MFKCYSPNPGTSNDVDKFDGDKLLAILEFTCLYKLKREIILQDFDLVFYTLDVFNYFCKRLERTHPHFGTSMNKRKKCDSQSDAE